MINKYNLSLNFDIKCLHIILPHIRINFNVFSIIKLLYIILLNLSTFLRNIGIFLFNWHIILLNLHILILKLNKIFLWRNFLNFIFCLNLNRQKFISLFVLTIHLRGKIILFLYYLMILVKC